MSNETMYEIVERIKSRRLQLNYSYQDLVTKTGLSKSTLQRYEAGAIKNIPLDKVKDLAKGLQVSPEWLMGWNETTTPSSSIDYAQTPHERKLLMLARHMDDIPAEKRERIIKNFEDTIDVYLDAVGKEYKGD